MTALEAHIMTLSLMWHEPFFLFIFSANTGCPLPRVSSGQVSSGQVSSGEWITLRRLPFRSRLPLRLPEFGGVLACELRPLVIRWLEESS